MRGKKIAVGGKSSNSNLSRVLRWSAWKRQKVRELPHNRLIPTAVKVEVWKRDKGKCVICGSQHNLQKHNKII